MGYRLDPIAATTVQHMAADVGNLTARLALMQAVVEDLVIQVNGLDPSQWEMEAREGGYTARISGEEWNRVQAILQTVRSLQ